MAPDGSSADRATLQGLVQLTVALAAPRQHGRGDEEPGTDPDHFPEHADAVAIRSSLGERFEAGAFTLHQITDLADPGRPNHSWLGPLSRHVPLTIGGDFLDAGAADFPVLLQWDRRRPLDNTSDLYLRAQRVQGSASPPASAGETTCNDYLLGAVGSDSLSQLRWFFARLYAQRRNTIFASQLAERMYHVWLPPALLRPSGQEAGGPGELALLPVASLTRQSGSRSWRHTGAVTVLVVPVEYPAPSGESSRATTRHELGSLVDSLRGSSFIAPEADATRYELVAGPLWDYLVAVGASCPVTRSVLAEATGAGRAAPDGTFRQWCELVTTAASERLWEWTGTQLPDEVLRAMRVNSFWSILAVVDDRRLDFPPETDPVPGWNVGGDVVEPEQLPEEINRLLARLRGSNDLFLPRPPLSRIDDLSSMEGTYLTWNVPGRRGIVTAYALTHESFPGESSLNLFGFLGHALLAAAYSSATVDALNREPPEPKSVVSFATKAHGLANELDEMFDLDIVSVQFQIMWRRLRRSIGMDDQYQLARERLELLAHYSEVIDQESREELAERVALMTAIGGALAAVVGVGILIFSVGLIIREVWPSAGVAVTVWCSSILFGVTVVLAASSLYLYRRWRHRPPRPAGARGPG